MNKLKQIGSKKDSIVSDEIVQGSILREAIGYSALPTTVLKKFKRYCSHCKKQQ